MRPAEGSDVPGVLSVVLARSAWLEERGLPSWRDSAQDVAAQAENGDGAVWVLEDERRVIGCTTLQEETPPWGWTAQELADPAWYLYTTVTDPAYRAAHPGALIAWWAVDRAAQAGKTWVRRGCMDSGLVGYYRRQGFTLLHEVQRTRNRVYLMSRQAERLPGLEELFAHPQRTVAVLTAPVT